METIKHILALLVLLGIFSSCNISNEEDCGGDGGIQVNQELYNEITVAVGETFSADLLGDPPLFIHPNNRSISLTAIGGDPNIANVLLDPNVGEATLFVTGKEVGSTIITIRAEDECAGERNPVSKEIQIVITQ